MDRVETVAAGLHNLRVVSGDPDVFAATSAEYLPNFHAQAHGVEEGAIWLPSGRRRLNGAGETPESPIETPVEMPIETPVETPVETSVEMLMESPIETPDSSADELPIETPVEMLIESPIETPDSSADESADEMPVETPKTPKASETPKKTPATPKKPAATFTRVGLKRKWIELKLEEAIDRRAKARDVRETISKVSRALSYAV